MKKNIGMECPDRKKGGGKLLKKKAATSARDVKASTAEHRHQQPSDIPAVP